MQELALIRPGEGIGGDSVPSQLSEADAALSAVLENRLVECAPLAFRVAYGVLRNTAEAEDVAQDALLRAYRRFQHLRQPDRFRGWLVRITFRIALDRCRSSKRREVRETQWSRPERAPLPPNAEELAIQNQFAEHLERAVTELPHKFRLVLLLCSMQGYTLEEVSDMLGTSIGTVKSRLFFARKKLAEKLRCHAPISKRS